MPDTTKGTFGYFTTNIELNDLETLSRAKSCKRVEGEGVVPLTLVGGEKSRDRAACQGQ